MLQPYHNENRIRWLCVLPSHRRGSSRYKYSGEQELQIRCRERYQMDLSFQHDRL